MEIIPTFISPLYVIKQITLFKGFGERYFLLAIALGVITANWRTPKRENFDLAYAFWSKNWTSAIAKTAALVALKNYICGADGCGLDSNLIPQFVVEFVLYHELLHKAIGVKYINGRYMAHTTEFRRQEQQFKFILEASQFLEKIANQKN